MFLFLEEARTKLASRFLEFEDYFIVDSMLLEISQFARHRRIKICKSEFETIKKKELKLYFYNYETYSELETIMLKLLKVLKQEFLAKMTVLTLVQSINKFIFIDQNNIKNQTI